jgi:hypothetical protein
LEARRLGVVQRAKSGNAVCGDAWLAHDAGERWLICVADGLGSGPAAREAAVGATDAVRANDALSLPDILSSCHEALRSTRGAAVGLLAVDPVERKVAFAGVGNVEARTRREWSFSPLSLPGIVGATNFRLPRVYEASFESGEWVVLHSDGLRSRFDLEIELARAAASGLVQRGAQALAEDLAERFSRDGDDVTLVVLQLP